MLGTQEVLTNMMISHLAFRAEEDPDVARYAFHKSIHVQVGIRFDNLLPSTTTDLTKMWRSGSTLLACRR